jgi:hypothetical protein
LPRNPDRARMALIDVSMDELIQGVLLGRYERCHGHRTLRHDAQASRVHACVLARQGRLWLVDAGSTNGTIILEGKEERELGPGRRVKVFN